MLSFVLGFLLVFGAVGGLENPDASLIGQLSLAGLGLILMYDGVNRIKENSND